MSVVVKHRSEIKPTLNATSGSKLKEIRDLEFVNDQTGEIEKIVTILAFEDGAEVVKPQNFQFRSDVFPKGICIGMKLACYWEDNKFICYPVE